MKEFFYIATSFPSEEGQCIDGYRREIFSSVEAAEDFIQKKYPEAKKASLSDFFRFPPKDIYSCFASQGEGYSEDEENDYILYCVIKLTLVE